MSNDECGKTLTRITAAKGVMFPVFKEILEITKKRTGNPTAIWAKARNS